MSQTNNITYVYNPANLDPSELITNFTVRKKEFKSIFDAIKNDNMKAPPQHFIIQGLRGNGKTTLLLRLFYEVKNDSVLQKTLIPVIFDEEEYGIRKLYKLWERIAEYLEDNSPVFEGIYDEMMKHISEDDYEETAYQILTDRMHQADRRIVLFFDNFGEILDKFTEKETRRLREILMGGCDIRIVGASSVVMETTFDYSKPFYEFFKIVQLKGLTKEEALFFLKKTAENYKKPEVIKIIEEHPERVETLRTLTEGVPRTMILLFEIFADNDNGNSFKDLEVVLDRVTPLYKHRMDELSKIQQEIVDIIARNWDGIEVSTIAEKTRMDSKSVSAQLNVLSKNNVISKIPTKTKNNIYILKERFFNIWYLMRYGRKKDENRVKWLTRFLEAWFGDELEERAKKHIEALQKGEIYDKHAFFMCEAFCQSEKISLEIEHDLVERTGNYLAEKQSPYYSELSKSDLTMIENAENLFNEKKYKESLNYLLKLKRKEIPEIIANTANCYLKIEDYKNAKKYYQKAMEKGVDEIIVILGLLYEIEYEDFKNAEKYYLMAVKKGFDAAMVNLGQLYETKYKNFKEAEKYYLMAAEKENSSAMNRLGLIYENKNDIKNAEKYYLMAIQKNNDDAMVNLGLFYHNKFNDEKKAKKYYLMATKQNNSLAMIGLGTIYEKNENYKDAEKYYLMAVNQNNVDGIRFLISFYFRKNTNKEKALKIATDKYKKNEKPFEIQGALALALLWNDKIEEGVKTALEFLSNKKSFKGCSDNISQLLIFMMAKQQYNTVLKIFNENKFDIKDRFKPVYYALMHFMKDKFPNEYLKMGSELKETVEEIIEEVEKYRNW